MKGLYDLAMVDSLTSNMLRDYYANKKKKDFDAYRNYAMEPMHFIEFCNKMNFNTVLILGVPGVGKTSLLESIIDSEYKPIIYELDSKDLPSLSLMKAYGTQVKPKDEFLKYRNRLSEVEQSLTQAKQKGINVSRLKPLEKSIENFPETFFTVFITAHLSDKIDLNDPREKMKIVGAMLDNARPEMWVNNVGIVRNKGGERFIEWEKDDTSPTRRTRGLFEDKNSTPASLKYLMDEYQTKLRPLYV